MVTTPIVKDLVLIGGGHSHVEVLKRFAMRPLAGVRITVISREVHTPYSGMLPGLIAGHYTFDDAHIDLGPLTRFARGRLYHDEVTAIDFSARRISCRERPPIPFDIVSLDIGSAPDTNVPGAAEFAIPVKPVSKFNARWELARDRVLAANRRLRIGVIGGGAGGIELLLALRFHLSEKLRAAGRDPSDVIFELVCASDEILPAHNVNVQRKFDRLLRAQSIALTLGQRVTEVFSGGVFTAQGDELAFDEIFWVTSASAAAWPQACGLATDKKGFIQVNPTLESSSHPGVFASGDIATVVGYPRPKSGVFAVRQGPPLAANLRRALRGLPLAPFKPQREFLSLISTGERYAIGSRGRWAIEGKWVWRLKDWIDRRFVRKYHDLPDMSAGTDDRDPIGEPLDELRELQNDPMRCGGCGSKVGADILHEALATLDQPAHPDVLLGLEQGDDAAVVQPHADTVLVQTVDAFRGFIDDPFLFGKIAANHCLSDIYAMGATPQTALAIVTLPLGAADKMRDDLTLLMHGAVDVFSAANTMLVGGHTNEGAELALGFAINGYIERGALHRKGGAQPGDSLILTKPLGTGVLFAAEMRGQAKTRWVENAVRGMLQSNAPAAKTLHDEGAHAITDVTGFGLLGHLIEMLRDEGIGAEIDLNACVSLPGVTQLIERGIVSSLQPSNLRVLTQVALGKYASDNPQLQLCCDPQTAGGLLAAVPSQRANHCVDELRNIGYGEAVIVGTIHERSAGEKIDLA